MITKIGCCVLVAGLWACGEQAVERRAPAPATPTPESPPSAQSPAPAGSDAPGTDFGSEYVVHSVCPFGFRYGKTTMIGGGTLRASPSYLSDSLGRVADGANVRMDSGIMILHPPGVGVLVAALESPSGPRVGDTVEILHYTGQENPSRVRWRGQEFEMLGLLQVLREPTQSWWVYMTDSATQVSGWMRMGGIGSDVNRAARPDGCGR